MSIRGRKSILEMPGDQAESRLVSRLLFLRSVQKLRPHVVSALWEMALYQFKSAVLKHFWQEIFGDPEDDLLKRFDERYAQFQKAPLEYPDPFVRQIQQKLTTSGMVPSPDKVRVSFGFWALLSEETTDLRKAILEWSKRWNLDSNWCRDHALAVLREWLFHDSMKWLHVFPHSKDSLQRTGWSLALNDIDLDAALTNVLADEQLYGSGSQPEELSFRSKNWLGNPFQIAWNTTAETEVDFKKRARVNFRITVDLVELTRLRPLAEDDARRRALRTREFDKELTWRNGILKEFEYQLARYISHTTRFKQQAKANHGVVEAPLMVKEAVWKWLVLYQVPQIDNKCLSYRDIAKEEEVTEVRIRQSVKIAARLIDLTFRNRYLHAGRHRASTKPILDRPHR